MKNIRVATMSLIIVVGFALTTLTSCDRDDDVNVFDDQVAQKKQMDKKVVQRTILMAENDLKEKRKISARGSRFIKSEQWNVSFYLPLAINQKTFLYIVIREEWRFS